MCLLARPVTDRFAMAMGGYLAGAFWITLIAAGAWPGTSYYFAGDPVYGNGIDDALERPACPTTSPPHCSCSWP